MHSEDISKHSILSIAILTLTATLSGCGAPAPGEDGTEPDTTEDTGVQSDTITVSGLGAYCSVTRADGASFFAWHSDDDPCQLLAPYGGTVRRKGLYSLSGENHVVMSCITNPNTNPPTQIFRGFEGIGDTPMAQAMADSANFNGPCYFSASFDELPILKRPFSDNVWRACNGFDYSRTANLPAIRPDGTTTPSVDSVNNQGRRPFAGSNGDPGHDCSGLPTGEPLYAMADGTVMLAGCWDTDVAKPEDDQHQRDIIIRHTIQGSIPGYQEQFYSLYAHMSEIDVTNGQIVTQGQMIGRNGATGSASGPHLHFMVGRGTNTVDQREETFQVPFPNSLVDCAATTTDDPDPVAAPHNLDQMIIDPWGWHGPSNMPDPWATSNVPYNTPTMAQPTQGGLSVNLWVPDQAPRLKHDYLFADGTYQIKTTTNNCMDVTGGSTSNALIQEWGCNGSNAQRWAFQKVSNDLYEIRSLISNKCLDVQGGSGSSGALVQQFTCNGTAAQRWKITDMDSSLGKFRIRPQTTADQLCLDSSDGSATIAGTQFHQRTCSGTNTQYFTYQLSE